ncbi:sodium/hydrogen exchanger [Clostridium sartagoforme AAU1]|uniref:Sodium/hydrogen exchanger n=1 Tax=Clostridium sartagoforme AAU1 TaxID=1202534 RepID=R9BVJ5_9CLOT|nr:cation:proton antiporter [Clostridium sartagoforme]EOR21164.1 sodium/hydrogen exchanger [Clostridium sartagoforme AAU1]
MLLSLALLFLSGMVLGKIFETLRLPKLLGMLTTGILLGPYVLNLLDPTILNISTELRQIALVIILTRAGLNLNIKDLKKVGRPAILMCFVPACFEIIGMLILAPMLLGITILDAAIMGTVIAAVSPAVIVPKMLKLMESEYGTSKSIPQMIMAGASVDDVFVIVLFTAFTGLAQGGTITAMHFLTIPTSIILGLLGGVVTGLFLSMLFSKVHIRDTGKVITILSISFLLITLEHMMTGAIGFSGLLAVMALGATLHQKKYEISQRLSNKFSKLWVGAEVLLFVLVGAIVNISYALNAGILSILLIFGVLLFRMIGVFICLINTNLNKKERVFTAFAYMPKATVQAAIGGLPLAMNLPCGNIVLTVAVLSIIITAPLGAILIDTTYKKFLSKNVN